MSQVQHYPLGTYAGQTTAFSVLKATAFDPTKKHMLLVVGHGQGEATNNLNDLAGLTRIYDWGGFLNFRAAVDQYPNIIVIFISTGLESKYSNREYQKAVEWAEINLPIDLNNICLLGHSLGSWGIGNYALTDVDFAKKINIWFISSAGPYNSTAQLYQNIADNDIRVWGVTALNDNASGTTPLPTQRVYDLTRQFNPQPEVLISEFPATTWPDAKQAHNSTISRINNWSWSGITKAMSRGGVLAGEPQMNMYQWALSNPKGSIFQSQDMPYTGPKYNPPPPPMTTTTTTTPPPVYISGINISPSNQAVSVIAEVYWTDGVKETYAPAAGDRLIGVWLSNHNNQIKATISFAIQAPIVLGPTKP